MLQQHEILTARERREKHRIILRDTVALCTLFGIVVLLSFVTYGLFHSFTAHRLMLQARWRARGEAALAAGKPVAAIESLHSALAYDPDDRGLQIELATALAASGRIQEAQVYFKTLRESAPGSGQINLQLARLAARQNNTQDAVDFYQAAIDGTWNGDAFTRRRAIRIELARYLIEMNRFAEARSLLLITSGNGPDDYQLQLTLGDLLEQANDSADAMDVYHKAASHKATRLFALQGQGHAAATLGRYAQARSFLAAAVAEPSFVHQPTTTREAVHQELDNANGILALYPADTLPNGERAKRIAKLAGIAQARLLACPAEAPVQAAAPGGAGSSDSTGTPASAPQRTQLLAALADHLSKLNPLARKAQPSDTGTSSPAGANATPAAIAAPAAPSSDPLAVLAARWTPMPTDATLQHRLASDPVFAQNTIQLVYETARATAGACGEPTGENELLAKIAEAPSQVEAQP